MQRTIRRDNFEFRFDPDEDVVNPSDMIPAGETNPHRVRPFILHDAGFVLAVVFADCLQDALDEAVDRDKLDRFQVTEAEMDDYQTGVDGDGNPEYEGITHLGNASEPFDIESLDAFDISPEAWTCEYWAEEQLRDQIESCMDDLTPSARGGCGYTDEGIDRKVANLAAWLKELGKRS